MGRRVTEIVTGFGAPGRSMTIETGVPAGPRISPATWSTRRPAVDTLSICTMRSSGFTPGGRGGAARNNVADIEAAVSGHQDHADARETGLAALPQLALAIGVRCDEPGVG